MSISRTIFLLRDIYHDRGQFTRDRVQRTGDKLQRRETVYRGHDLRNRDVRHGTKGGYIRQRIYCSFLYISFAGNLGGGENKGERHRGWETPARQKT
jgi:hypothetical protein